MFFLVRKEVSIGERTVMQIVQMQLVKSELKIEFSLIYLRNDLHNFLRVTEMLDYQ